MPVFLIKTIDFILACFFCQIIPLNYSALLVANHSNARTHQTNSEVPFVSTLNLQLSLLVYSFTVRNFGCSKLSSLVWDCGSKTLRMAILRLRLRCLAERLELLAKLNESRFGWNFSCPEVRVKLFDSLLDSLTCSKTSPFHGTYKSIKFRKIPNCSKVWINFPPKITSQSVWVIQIESKLVDLNSRPLLVCFTEIDFVRYVRFMASTHFYPP